MKLQRINPIWVNKSQNNKQIHSTNPHYYSEGKVVLASKDLSFQRLGRANGLLGSGRKSSVVSETVNRWSDKISEAAQKKSSLQKFNEMCHSNQERSFEFLNKLGDLLQDAKDSPSFTAGTISNYVKDVCSFSENLTSEELKNLVIKSLSVYRPAYRNYSWYFHAYYSSNRTNFLKILINDLKLPLFNNTKDVDCNSEERSLYEIIKNSPYEDVKELMKNVSKEDLMSDSLKKELKEKEEKDFLRSIRNMDYIALDFVSKGRENQAKVANMLNKALENSYDSYQQDNAFYYFALACTREKIKPEEKEDFYNNIIAPTLVENSKAKEKAQELKGFGQAPVDFLETAIYSWYHAAYERLDFELMKLLVDKKVPLFTNATGEEEHQIFDFISKYGLASKSTTMKDLCSPDYYKLTSEEQIKTIYPAKSSDEDFVFTQDVKDLIESLNTTDKIDQIARDSEKALEIVKKIVASDTKLSDNMRAELLFSLIKTFVGKDYISNAYYNTAVFEEGVSSAKDIKPYIKIIKESLKIPNAGAMWYTFAKKRGAFSFGRDVLFLAEMKIPLFNHVDDFNNDSLANKILKQTLQDKEFLKSLTENWKEYLKLSQKDLTCEDLKHLASTETAYNEPVKQNPNTVKKENISTKIEPKIIQAQNSENIQSVSKSEVEHVDSVDIFNVRNIISPYIIETYLKANPNKNINSKDSYGNTILTKAIEELDVDTIKTLTQFDDVDWYAKNSAGENIVANLMRSYSDSPNQVNKIFELLRNLPESKFDINKLGFRQNDWFYDHEESLTVLEKVLHGNESLLPVILKFKNLDPNIYSAKGMPPILNWDSRRTPPKWVITLLDHPNIDLKTTYKGQEVGQILRKRFENSTQHSDDWYYYNTPQNVPNRYLEALERAASRQVLNKARKIYDKVGMLTLGQIKEISEAPNAENFINSSINSIDENLGHLLAETTIEQTNFVQIILLNDIIRNLLNNKFDFSQTDAIGRTPLMIAAEAENLPFINLVLNSSAEVGNLDEVLEIVRNSNNKELKKIFNTI